MVGLMETTENAAYSHLSRPAAAPSFLATKSYHTRIHREKSGDQESVSSKTYKTYKRQHNTLKNQPTPQL